MISETIHTFLISLSPFGESRVGIPYGIVSGLHPLWALAVGLAANLLVFPILTFLLEKFNMRFWKFKPYRRQSIKVAQRAKRGVGEKIRKYGFWGLMIFVMIPLPVTGAYAGTIAAYIFKLKRRHAFLAISIGLAISCCIMATGTYFGKLGFSLI